MDTSQDPFVAIWEITRRCNLKCLHCGSSAGSRRSNELSTKEGIGLIHDLARIGFQGVALFGGEPFLRKDWCLFGKEINEYGMKLSIATNGVIDPVKIVNKVKIDSISVALDGASSKTHDHIRGIQGAFEKTLDFVKGIKETGIELSVVTAVHKMNFHELPQMRDLILDLGVSWCLLETIPIGRCTTDIVLNRDEFYSLGLFMATTYKLFASQGLHLDFPHNFGINSTILPVQASYGKWKGCWAGKRLIGIQSNGDVKGCLAISDAYVEGNIRERSVIDIWNDPNSFGYNRYFKNEDLGEKCKDCALNRSCKGGCTTRSIAFTGRPNNDPFCFYKMEREFL